MSETERIKEILMKQLELLHEKSLEADVDDLCSLTTAIARILT